jgi:hypothetical protein
MNSQLMALRVAGTIFGLVCLAQIIRFLLGADVAVADHHLPLWPSAIAAVITGALAFWMWRLAIAGHGGHA